MRCHLSKIEEQKLKKSAISVISQKESRGFIFYTTKVDYKGNYSMIASAQTSNSKLAQINKKLTVQSQNFAKDSYAIRSLDWDRSRFDIEFGLRNGTTYNSFIIKGEKLAIIDTSHAKFEELWFEELLKKVNLHV